MVEKVRVLEVLARGAVGGLLVVGPTVAFAPTAVATSAVAIAPDTLTLPFERDPFVPWDERDAQEAQEARAAKEAREARVTVDGGSSGPALAATGFDAPATATLGMLAFAVGLALVRLGRRRPFGSAR